MVPDEEIIKILGEKGIVAPLFGDGKDVLIKALWILKVTKDNTSVEALSPEGISKIAHKILDEDIKPNSITNALARAENKIKRHDKGFVEIMGPGRKELEGYEVLNEKGIRLVTGEKPWTDKNKEFVRLVENFEGEVLILDPYYGVETLDALSNFKAAKKVKFLTSKPGGRENPILLAKQLVRFKKEFKHMEIKSYPKFDELHDRYIISDNFFVIIGHGLKDMGNRECFLIALPRSEVKGVVDLLITNFKRRWGLSNTL